jgi:hypothetical protein
VPIVEKECYKSVKIPMFWMIFPMISPNFLVILHENPPKTGEIYIKYFSLQGINMETGK